MVVELILVDDWLIEGILLVETNNFPGGGTGVDGSRRSGFGIPYVTLPVYVFPGS